MQYEIIASAVATGRQMYGKATGWLGTVFILYIWAELATGCNVATSVYSIYQNVTDLDGENTVYEYMTASDKRSVRFYMRICDDGVCLSEQDWKCGFWVRGEKFEQKHGQEEFLDLIKSCFSAVAREVPVYTKLDKVRKICGRQYMVFDPIRSPANKKDCAAAKGQWGKKQILWLDEQSILAKAKIR